MKKRKAFIYTLEAVLAASLFLGTVTILIPRIESQSAGQRGIQERIHSGLYTLDRTGQLRDNLSRKEIETELEPYVPAGYLHSVSLRKSGYTERQVSSPDNISISRKGDEFELQLWISSSSGLNATFRDTDILQSHDGEGYVLREPGNGEGYLNFTGSGELELRFRNYSTGGTIPSGEEQEVRNVNYILHRNSSWEVKVSLWQEE